MDQWKASIGRGGCSEACPALPGDNGEKRMKKIAAIIGIALAVFAGYVVSHPGGLDKYGCHKDHKLGDYHCH